MDCTLGSKLYGNGEFDSARCRYQRLIDELVHNTCGAFPRNTFPEVSGAVRLFSVPGRTELGGNHTDHNRGKVLAASVHLDIAAVAAPRNDTKVFFRSTGHADVQLDLGDLSPQEHERGTTAALIRGIASGFAQEGTPVRGFTANAESQVCSGSGLSSSAAVEVLVAMIFDTFFARGKRSALQLAKISQQAETLYFGKPCGLMDQSACASGGVIAIDFDDPDHPHISKLTFDPSAACFALCVLNTHTSHADLLSDYAAIPLEMKAVAGFFGKDALRDLDEQVFFDNMSALRKTVNDRAILRALHFYNENRRVDAMCAALNSIHDGSALPEKAMTTFLALVQNSGNSSLELLQNIYAPANPVSQGLSLALALTKKFLDKDGGACRVHGGGFAGTIQTYIPLDRITEYRLCMEAIFGEGSLTVLRIRSQGAGSCWTGWLR